jgi:hypothetical protein
MNTPVSFEIAKLLKEKGFIDTCEKVYRSDGLLYTPMMSGSKLMHSNILEDGSVSAPTIAEVVMWLYEKHEYWCYTYTNGKMWYPCIQHKFGDMAVLSGKIGTYNSSIEAYEEAIKYTLNNLI